MENPYASVYGLTGIMGSGKSAAANFFREQGAVVFNADEIARSVIDPRSAWYTQLKAKLVAAFSVFTQEPLFDSAGELNRALLAQLTFGHDERVRLLNSIMHPVIQREFANRLLAVRDPEEKVIIYDVPLLFETGLEKKLKATIVVYAPEEVCIARVLARAAERGEKITAEEIRQRLRSQISIEKKRELADYIINNTGSLDDLRAEVSQLYQKLRGL